MNNTNEENKKPDAPVTTAIEAPPPVGDWTQVIREEQQNRYTAEHRRQQEEHGRE